MQAVYHIVYMVVAVVVAVVVVVVVVVAVVVVLIIITLIIKLVVTGQAPVTLEWRDTPRKTNTNKSNSGVAYIIADATNNASARKI